MGNVNINYQNSATSELEKGFLESLPNGYESFADVGKLSSLGIDALMSELGAIVSGRGGEVLSFFLVAFGATLLIAFASLSSSPLSPSVRGGVGAAASMAMFAALYPLFCSVSEALEGINGFFSALIPSLTSFLAIGGGVGTATGAASGLGITLWLTGLISGELLLPMTVAVFASSAISSSVGGASERVSASISRSFKRLVGALGAVVAAAFSLQTYVSVAADSVRMRAAKYAASGLIPVVGSTVSGALSTLGGGLSLLGGIIGASSVAVIIAMALSPLVLLLLYKLALYVCTLFLEFTGTGNSSSVGAFSSALDALISVYVMTIIIYIFEIIVLIWGGKTVFG